MKNAYKIIYSLIDFLIGQLGKISLRSSMVLVRFLGKILFFFDSRHRKIAFKNLKHIYGHHMTNNTRQKVVRGVYRNLSQSIFDVGWLMKASSEEIENRLKIKGSKHITDAYSAGKGLLIISGHIGAWELLPFIISKLKIPLNIIYRPLDFEPLNRFIEKFRTMFGGNLISKKRAIPKINEVLRRGEAVGLLIDQSADWYDGVWVDFFGRRTCTNKGIARIALDTQVPVIPAFVLRKGDNFRAFFKEAIPLVNTGDKTKDIEINTLNYTKVIETEICKSPEQWFWVHRRWKNKAYSYWPKE